jgi:hypothetical protein
MVLKIFANRRKGKAMEQHLVIRAIAHDAVIAHLNTHSRGAAGRLANALRISPAIISEIRRNPERNTSMETCAKIIDHLRHEIPAPVLATIESNAFEGSTISLEHERIIKKFKNQHLAKEINGKLLELESYDPDMLLRIIDLIDGMLTAVKPRKNNNSPG